MSENNAETNVAETETGSGASESGYTAPATQADLDRIIEGRLMRDRAKYADYDDLKSAAEKLAEIEDAKKSADEKTAERIAALERNEAAALAKAEAAELKSLKSEVARDKGVPVGHLVGKTKEELEASADELVKWRDENAPSVRKPLRSGFVQGEDVKTTRQRAAQLLRG